MKKQNGKFEIGDKVYFVDGEYPYEAVNWGFISLFFNQNDPEQELYVGIHASWGSAISKKLSECYANKKDASDEWHARQNARREEYRSEIAGNKDAIIAFMLKHDCVMGQDKIAREVVIEQAELLGIKL